MNIIQTQTVSYVHFSIIYIICRYGGYKSLISDRGTTFLSSIFKHLLNMCQVTHLVSTSYRHQTAGAAERQIQSLKRFLAKHCNESLKDSDQHLARFVSITLSP